MNKSISFDNKRKKVFEWWVNLKFHEQKNIAERHYPDIDLVTISISPSMIQVLYEKSVL